MDSDGARSTTDRVRLAPEGPVKTPSTTTPAAGAFMLKTPLPGDPTLLVVPEALSGSNPMRRLAKLTAPPKVHPSALPPDTKTQRDNHTMS